MSNQNTNKITNKNTNLISILSFNICIDQISTLFERFNIFTNNIFNIKPDIIFLQESSIVSMNKFKNTYHIISSTHTPIFEIYHYIPTIFLSIVSTIMYLFNNKLYFFIFTLFAFILLPHFLLFLIQKIFRFSNIFKEVKTFDWMAQTICASKDQYKDMKLLEITPFSYIYRGYIKPSQLAPTRWYNLFLWLRWWFNMLLIRPGFMIVKVIDNMNQEILLVNCHLITGVTNSIRMKQIKIINDAINKYNIKNVIWCGDFNADEIQPEINLLTQFGYIDSCVKLYPTRNLDEHYTWENYINPYTPHGEPNQRVDYIWYKNDSFIAKKYNRIFDGINLPISSDHYGVYTELETL